ncbi:hypothetical protein PR048_023143 [Dryococelus australis]|uniref:Uncharacterized protein n=1 Tax=Dryococelus australis TaxID=614101 RepID=A0ABQ9GT95_9NEOP|nr:hypothetical protein PR048_023143 [Dryococelus australis]
MEQRRNEGAGKREILEKTRRPTASSGTIPNYENLGVTRRGIETDMVQQTAMLSISPLLIIFTPPLYLDSTCDHVRYLAPVDQFHPTLRGRCRNSALEETSRFNWNEPTPLTSFVRDGRHCATPDDQVCGSPGTHGLRVPSLQPQAYEGPNCQRRGEALKGTPSPNLKEIGTLGNCAAGTLDPDKSKQSVTHKSTDKPPPPQPSNLFPIPDDPRLQRRRPKQYGDTPNNAPIWASATFVAGPHASEAPPAGRSEIFERRQPERPTTTTTHREAEELRPGLVKNQWHGDNWFWVQDRSGNEPTHIERYTCSQIEAGIWRQTRRKKKSEHSTPVGRRCDLARMEGERERESGLVLQATTLLLASDESDPGSIPGRATPDFHMWESYRTMSLVDGFSRGSPASPALSFRCCSIATSIILIGFQDLDVKSRPNLFTLKAWER